VDTEKVMSTPIGATLRPKQFGSARLQSMPARDHAKTTVSRGDTRYIVAGSGSSLRPSMSDENINQKTRKYVVPWWFCCFASVTSPTYT
jgi:hypothetical protein